MLSLSCTERIKVWKVTHHLFELSYFGCIVILEVCALCARGKWCHDFYSVLSLFSFGLFQFTINKLRVLSQNGLSTIFDIFKVRAPSYNTNNTFLMIPFSLHVYKGIFLILSKVLQIFLLFSLYFSSLSLIYLKLTKMDITCFAMKLFESRSVCILTFSTFSHFSIFCAGYSRSINS